MTGNLLALCSGLCFAGYLLSLRHSKARTANRASSVIFGNLLVLLIAAPFGLKAIPKVSLPDGLSVLYLGVVQLGLGYTLLTAALAQGVRSLAAGIIGYIEPALNPIWVFLVLGERPRSWSLLGGAIIIIVIVCHTLFEAKRRKQVVVVP